MAKFQVARFAPAASAVVAAGTVLSAADTAGTQAACKSLAGTLPEGHAAVAGLLAVARLRPSIARRFVTIAVPAAVAASAPVARKPRKSRKSAV